MASRRSPGFLPLWDIWVRLFHWTLACAVLFQLFNGETGTGFYDWHRLLGECILALLAFRLLWGLMGSAPARLLPLIRSPLAALAHLKHLLRGDVQPEAGHNAAGGWAVLVLLVLLLVQAATGMVIADEDELVEGAYYGAVSSDWTDLAYSVHHYNAGVLQALVLLHIVMILVYWLRAGLNLVAPMLHGKVNTSGMNDDAIALLQRPRRLWLGAVIVLLVAAAFYIWLWR